MLRPAALRRMRAAVLRGGRGEGMYSGVLKTFLDEVQTRCFGWPVKALRWRAGAAFATGAHVASGKEATINAIHTFYHSVQTGVHHSNDHPGP